MILLIGYGYWGKNLARNFYNSNSLYAICEADENRLLEAQEKYPTVKFFNDINLAIKDKNVNAVAIATKAKTHYEIAKQCLNMKKDLWIEKPVTENIKQIDELIKLSEKTKTVVFVDYTFCYNPAVRKIKEIDIGTPVYYDSSRISMGLFQHDVDVILDLAIHDVSILNYLYPDLEIKDRQIIKNSHLGAQANQTLINLVFKNNFTATINCNWLSPVKKRQIILTGTTKSIVYDDISVDKINLYEITDLNIDFNLNKLGNMITPTVESKESLSIATEHFLNCMSNRLLPITNLYGSKKIMEWIL